MRACKEPSPLGSGWARRRCLDDGTACFSAAVWPSPPGDVSARNGVRTMDILLNTVGVLVAFIAAFAALGYAADRWAVNSRPSEPAREWWEHPW
jgi:hypothetical protein